MEFRRILSVKRNEELIRQTKTGEDLPEIDEAQLQSMLEGTLASPGCLLRRRSSSFSSLCGLAIRITKPTASLKSTSASSCRQCPGGPEIFGPGGRPIGIRRNYGTDSFRTVHAFCVADTSSQSRLVVNCRHEHDRICDSRQSTLGHLLHRP